MPGALGPDAIEAQVREICARNVGLEGPMLPILHEIQATLGFVPQRAVPVLAEALNVTRAEVHGVVSFYHDFRTAPAGRHVLRICRAEACQAMGGAGLAELAKEELGVDWHGTTPDGAVTLEPVFCLGLCACGPAAMVDGRGIGRLDGEGLDALIGEMRA